MGEIPTRESLTEVISSLPDGSSANCKHFVGFYNDDDVLIAVLDLITGYPESDDAFIGWLMVDGAMHGRGVGSGIFADVRASLKAAGYDYISLGVIKENAEALQFWKAQGFRPEGETIDQSGHSIIRMARSI